MRTCALFLPLLLATAGPALAGEENITASPLVTVTGNALVKELSQRASLSEREVARVFDNHRSDAERHYERRPYDRAVRRLGTAIGRDTTARLMNGETVQLPAYAQASRVGPAVIAYVGDAR